METCLSREEIRALLGGQLSQEQRGASWRHVSGCGRCQGEMEAVSAAREAAAAEGESSAAQADDRFRETTPVGLKRSSGLATDATVDVDTPASARHSIGGYEIVGELHRGGQGVVFKALQTATKRNVAVKVLLQGRFASERQRYRFEREIDLVASLQHSNIVTIFDSGITADGQPYYAMEYIHGKPIAEYVVEKELPLEAALELFVKVCVAINHAHLRGVIHRDLKPANILVDSAGEPHILDFGLAKMAGSGVMQDGSLVTVSGEFMGTLAYASPEQVEGDPNSIDIRSDVYSLGVILYQMLTAEFPYVVAGDMGEVLRNIRESEPTRPTVIRRQLGDEVETIVLTALAKERERRYQTAEAFGRDVQRFLHGEPIEAKRDSGLYLLRKTLARYRWPVSIGAAFFLLVVAGSVALLVLYQRQRAATELAEKKTLEAQGARGEAEVVGRLAEQRAEELRRTLYANRIALAEIAHVQENTTRLRSLLEECPEDLRGWEWYRLHWLQDRGARVLPLDSRGVDATWSASGERFMVCAGNAVEIRSRETGHTVVTLEAPQRVRNVATSPDGAWIAATGERTVYVWNARTGELQLTGRGHNLNVRCLAFSADGRFLASGADGVGIWSPLEKRLVSSRRGHFGGVEAVAFSPDGERIATGGGLGGISLWSLDAVEPLHALRGHGNRVHAIAFSPDGEKLVSASSDRTVKLWSCETGGELATMRGHTTPVSYAVFTTTGAEIISIGLDGTVRFWDGKTGESGDVLLGHIGSVLGSARHEDRLLTLNGREARIWELPAARDLDTSFVASAGLLPVPLYDGTFSDDGQQIVVATGPSPEFLRGRYSIRVVDVDSGATVLQPRTGWQLVRAEEPVYAIDFDDASGRIASGSADRTVRLWSRESGQELAQFRGHEADVRAVRFGAAGVVVSGDVSGRFIVWDTATQQPRGDWRCRQEGSAATESGVVALSSDAAMAFHAAGQWGALFSTSDGQLRHELAEPEAMIRAAEFSPDGTLLLLGLRNGLALVVETATAAVLRELRGHDSSVTALALTPDGRRIATGDLDGTIRIWNVVTGEELLAIDSPHGEVNSLFFSPDGSRLGSTSRDGRLVVRKTTFGR